MITNRNIVCISTPPWESNYASTTVQLMRELARNNKVLFVNNPFTAKDVWQGIRKKKDVPVKKVFGIRPRLKNVQLDTGETVHVLTPPMTLSIQFLSNGILYRTLLQWNGWLLRRAVKHYLKKLQMQQDLICVVAFNPTLGLEVGRRLHEKLLLYLCYDEIAAAPHLKKHGVWQEQQFAKLADAVIVTSQGLYERKRALANQCFVVKNAANFQLFSRGFNPQIPEKKQVGFIGGIDRRLDYSLLEQMITRLRDVQFIFVGRIVSPQGAEILKKFPNVILAGPKPLTKLPQFLKQVSVGIIPFVKSDFIKTVYPLKLNEYLSAGLPVVTTNFSYLDEFKSVVRIAETSEEFIQFVIDEIEHDSITKKTARQDFARHNTWQHRAEELSAIIEKLETPKQS